MDDWIIFDFSEGKDFHQVKLGLMEAWIITLKIHINGSGWDAIVSEAFEEPKGKWSSELIELTKLTDTRYTICSSI